MPRMETETIKNKINSALDFQQWQIHNQYKRVSALLFYWEESDHAGFEKEARSLGELFSNDFHFEVDYYAIPSEQSYIKLDTRINLLLSDRGHQDHLIIIYYGGHGDPNDEDGEEKLAVWAA